MTKKQIAQIRKKYAAGIVIGEMTAFVLKETGERISVATVRKYVQLGLVERSVRRGLGAGCGSRGYYPATSLIQLLEVRRRVQAGEVAAEIAEGSMAVHRDLDIMRNALAAVAGRAQQLCGRGRSRAQARHQLELARLTMARNIDQFASILGDVEAGRGGGSQPSSPAEIGAARKVGTTHV